MGTSPPPIVSSFGGKNISNWARKWWPTIAIVTGFCFVALLIVARYARPVLEKLAHDKTQNYLQEHFKGSVQFSDFHLSLYPHLQVAVDGLVVRHNNRLDIPPLVQATRVTFHANLYALFGVHPRVSNVRLEGLVINMPPRIPGGPPMIHGTDQNLSDKFPVILSEIHADDVVLVILRRDQKPPNQFALHQLVLYNFRFDNPASFHAVLTIPKPHGDINCDGEFGPWEAVRPSETPIFAKYTFRNADLGTLKGVKGILSSDGRFGGPLDYLNVEGATDTPDFALRTSDHPIALHTDFTAVVDGTNGNTILKNVTAKLLHSTIIAQGQVVDQYPKQKGRTIVLDAVATDARIEDFLLLAVKSNTPVMTGAVRLKTKILIPEEDSDIIDRLILDGRFGLNAVHFSSPAVQGKIDSLSRRGQGHPNQQENDANAMSELKGTFRLENASIRFSDLTFRVEGASIALGGSYNIDSGGLDFRGKLRLDAKLSQTVTGWKSFLLKPFDGFFKGKGVGTEVPIKITGTRDSPAFGLDFNDKENKK